MYNAPDGRHMHVATLEALADDTERGAGASDAEPRLLPGQRWRRFAYQRPGTWSSQ